MLNFIFTFKLGFIECDIHESKDKIVKLLNFSNYKNNIIFILNLVFLLVWINLNCTEKTLEIMKQFSPLQFVPIKSYYFDEN